MGRKKTLYTKAMASLFILYSLFNNRINTIDYFVQELYCSERQIRRYISEINLVFCEFHLNIEIKYKRINKTFVIESI